MAMMLGNDGIKDGVFRERDMICLSLDGFRRAARLCCTLGKLIQLTLVYSLKSHRDNCLICDCMLLFESQKGIGKSSCIGAYYQRNAACNHCVKHVSILQSL